MLVKCAESVLLNVHSQLVSMCTATPRELSTGVWSTNSTLYACGWQGASETPTKEVKVIALERGHTDDKTAFIVHIFQSTNNFKLHASQVDCNYN